MNNIINIGNVVVFKEGTHSTVNGVIDVQHLKIRANSFFIVTDINPNGLLVVAPRRACATIYDIITGGTDDGWDLKYFQKKYNSKTEFLNNINDHFVELL